MRSFLLNKLVRDKIFDSMLELGQKPHERKLNKDEYITELKKKLLEETKEFDPKSPDAPKELADLLEVIEALGSIMNVSFEELRKIQEELREKKGGFDRRIYISRLDLKDNDQWVDYYSSEPDRFKEL